MEIFAVGVLLGLVMGLIDVIRKNYWFYLLN